MNVRLHRAVPIAFVAALAAIALAFGPLAWSAPGGGPGTGPGGTGAPRGPVGPGLNQSFTVVEEGGETTIVPAQLRAALAEIPVGTLTDAERDGLIFMREEEKLARDLYMAFGQKWNARVFANIARSETSHMEAMKFLLDRYSLKDPAAGMAPGKFANADLQKLYDQQMAAGMTSLAAALRASALVEEVDIVDLQRRRSDKRDVQYVYDNLERASRNHLRAFVANLKNASGEVYKPGHLAPDAYAKIVAAPIERGGR